MNYILIKLKYEKDGRRKKNFIWNVLEHWVEKTHFVRLNTLQRCCFEFCWPLFNSTPLLPTPTTYRRTHSFLVPLSFQQASSYSFIFCHTRNVGLLCAGKTKPHSILAKRPEEDLQVLGSKPCVDLDTQLLGQITKLHTSVTSFGCKIVLPL